MKVFVLGRPGSGKSTAARHIIKCMNNREYQAVRLKDYPILHDMFLADVEGKFRGTEFGGFDVLDFAVFDTAIKRLEYEATLRLSEPNQREVMTIEFARDEYLTPLRLFDLQFLRDAHFLFVDADLETCIQRIHARVSRLGKLDCHFVSDYIMHSYYAKENDWSHLEQEIRERYTIGTVEIIHNTGNIEQFFEKIEQFVTIVLAHELASKQKTAACGSPIYNCDKDKGNGYTVEDSFVGLNVTPVLD